MDSGDCAIRCQDSSNKVVGIAFDVCNVESIKDVVQPPTPDTNREIGDFSYSCLSPITAVKNLPKVPCYDTNGSVNEDQLAFDNNGSPKTPEDGVFDPFAPGPDAMALAPLCKMYSDEMRGIVARRLNFEYPVKRINFGLGAPEIDAESISDEEILESLYKDILETVLKYQAESISAAIAEGKYDGCKTPSSAPLLNGIADTCPGAPIKLSGKARNIDLGLCRKLKF